MVVTPYAASKNDRKTARSQTHYRTLLPVDGATVRITAAKPGKWDCYLSDVRFSTPSGEELYLNELLLQNGQTRIKTRGPLRE